jgi:hypothetical protein
LVGALDGIDAVDTIRMHRRLWPEPCQA